MGFHYTNNNNVSLALAVWLSHDEYDYSSDPNVISATTLLKSTKAICLARQNIELSKQVDLTDLVASSMGTALHDSIERSWRSKKLPETLSYLGYGNIVDRVKVNSDSLEPGDIPIYLEQRSIKPVRDMKVSGKFDICIDGKLGDIKSTSVWKYIFGTGEDYIIQGSIYRWLNPDKITGDLLDIYYIFTDWSKVKATQDSSYPQSRVLTKEYRLMSTEDTEQWLNDKVYQIESNMPKHQKDMPLCTDKELWAKSTVYKYYKNPNKLTRATKNFDTMSEALARQGQDGNVGVVKEVPGTVMACNYCNVSGICEQREQLIQEGRLQ